VILAAAKKAAKKAAKPGVNVYTFVRGLGHVVVEEE
tara:strand:+ start:144 stop:251 length:108 start_codon:yes stop_codon:yes gene_type:complete